MSRRSRSFHPVSHICEFIKPDTRLNIRSLFIRLSRRNDRFSDRQVLVRTGLSTALIEFTSVCGARFILDVLQVLEVLVRRSLLSLGVVQVDDGVELIDLLLGRSTKTPVGEDFPAGE